MRFFRMLNAYFHKLLLIVAPYQKTTLWIAFNCF